MEWEEFPYEDISVEDIPDDWQERVENWLESKGLVKLITGLTLKYGSEGKHAFWHVAQHCFLLEEQGLLANDTTWRKGAARLLGISYEALRQRECGFVRWIEPLLEKYGKFHSNGRKRAEARA